MPGLVPGIHVLLLLRKTWMAGTSSAKTRFALLPGHDVVSTMMAKGAPRLGIKSNRRPPPTPWCRACDRP
jgi:hypothetical protein